MVYSDYLSGDIPDHSSFTKMREEWRARMANDENTRKMAIELLLEVDKFKYGYQWEWCGIPIIRHPDDIILQQEIMWTLKPIKVIETGVARGGSLALSASILNMYSETGKVLGLDIKILPHTVHALSSFTESAKVTLVECDSTSSIALMQVEAFIGDDTTPVLLVLDSNHTHDHVLRELNLLTQPLPTGSIIIVADTIIEEMPVGFYTNRPWNKGNNPLTAIEEFLELNANFEEDQRWSRRSLLGEFRGGILIKHSE